MSSTKHHPASAARRREQQRQERQQRLHIEQKQRSRTRGRNTRRSRGHSPWPMIGIVVLLVVIVVGIFLFLSRQQQASTESATAAVWKTITSPASQTLAAVANGSADNNVKQTFYQGKNKPPILKGPHGKPQIFYLGAEFCPYCAGQRWGVIVALSRFGTFSNVSPIISSESSVPSYSFHGSTYTSQYVDFVPVEVQDNQGQPLEKLTSQQEQIVNKYDAPPYTQPHNPGASPFPFMSLGNQIVVAGGTVDASLLTGHSHADIATQLKDPGSNIAKSVLGVANYLTTSICSLTNNLPAKICNAAPIPQLHVSLSRLAPKVLGPGRDQQLALITTLPEMVTSRRKLLS
jgi:hypothetical protein